MSRVNLHFHNQGKVLLGAINSPFYYVIGQHPWQQDRPLELSEWEQHLSDPYFIGLGEVGADKFKDNYSSQLEKFSQQLEWAISKNISYIVLHNLKASDDLIRIFDKYNYTGIIHWHDFNGTVELFEQWNKKYSFIISVGAKLLHSKKLELLVKSLPLQSLFLETDDSSDPALLAQLYTKTATIRDVNEEELQRAMHYNFTELIKLIKNNAIKGSKNGRRTKKNDHKNETKKESS